MPLYDVKVVVEYYYEVEAENFDEAEKAGWDYEDYAHTGEVYSIDITEHDSEEENEDE